MNTGYLLRRIPQVNRPGSITFRRISNYAGKAFTLNTGAKIPAIGCGTFQDNEQQEGAVSEALKAGVRLIDTARVYVLLSSLSTIPQNKEEKTNRHPATTPNNSSATQ